jgi:hypothetical protein
MKTLLLKLYHSRPTLVGALLALCVNIPLAQTIRDSSPPTTQSVAGESAVIDAVTPLASQYERGQTFGFTMTLRNNGTVALTGLEVTAVIQDPSGKQVDGRVVSSGIDLSVGQILYTNSGVYFQIPSNAPAGGYSVWVVLSRPSPLKTFDSEYGYFSVVVPTLSLDVQPSGTQTVQPGQALTTYTITVRDQVGNPVGGASVGIQNGVSGGTTSVTTVTPGGTASYNYTVPGNATAGTYTITFGPATKSGYANSGTVSMGVTVSGVESAVLNYITPLASSYEPGQIFGFTMGVSNTGTVALSGLEVDAVVQRPDGQVVSHQVVNSGINLAVGESQVLNSGQFYSIPGDAPSGTYTFYATLRQASPLKNFDAKSNNFTVVVPTLSLDVQPGGTQTVQQGQALPTYTITVRDQAGNPVG